MEQRVVEGKSYEPMEGDCRQGNGETVARNQGWMTWEMLDGDGTHIIGLHASLAPATKVTSQSV